MYELKYNKIDGKVSSIKRLSDKASIPISEGNKDYQEFLKWNSEQETPLNTDSIDQVTVDVASVKTAKQEKKKKDIEDNLVTWKVLRESIDAATTVKDLKAIVKKLAKVIYCISKEDGIENGEE